MPRIVDDLYKLTPENMEHIGNKIDVRKILDCANKKMPVSFIHGDFSLGNIIVSHDKNYLIDWELARTDFIIKDLYKVLLRKYYLFCFFNTLMSEEIKNVYETGKDNTVSLSYQFIIEHLIRLHSCKKKSFQLSAPLFDYIFGNNRQ